MDASTFIFRAGQYDDEFHRLYRRIADMARATPGYLGEETWENAEAGLVQNVYYWESEAALRQLMQHPAHLEAKAKQARWLDGYRVVISRVLREYGDGKLTQPHAGHACTTRNTYVILSCSFPSNYISITKGSRR